MTEAIENQIERFAPGFRDTVVERYTKNAVADGGVEPQLPRRRHLQRPGHPRQMLARPVPRWNTYKTPVRGVYLASAATPPGPGGARAVRRQRRAGGPARGLRRPERAPRCARPGADARRLARTGSRVTVGRGAGWTRPRLASARTAPVLLGLLVLEVGPSPSRPSRRPRRPASTRCSTAGCRARRTSPPPRSARAPAADLVDRPPVWAARRRGARAAARWASWSSSRVVREQDPLPVPVGRRRRLAGDVRRCCSPAWSRWRAARFARAVDDARARRRRSGALAPPRSPSRCSTRTLADAHAPTGTPSERSPTNLAYPVADVAAARRRHRRARGLRLAAAAGRLAARRGRRRLRGRRQRLRLPVRRRHLPAGDAAVGALAGRHGADRRGRLGRPSATRRGATRRCPASSSRRCSPSSASACWSSPRAGRPRGGRRPRRRRRRGGHRAHRPELPGRPRPWPRHRREARTDELTGLANRRAFNEALERRCAARPPAQPLALLRRRPRRLQGRQRHPRPPPRRRAPAARRPRGCSRRVRGDDLLARIGGDEFAVLLAGADAEPRPRRSPSGCRPASAGPFRLGAAGSTSIAPSVGIAARARRRREPVELLQHADLAMYEAKAAPQRARAVLPADLHPPSRERLETTERLRRRSRTARSSLHYQPQVSLRTGEVIGVEALVRWQHPEAGLLPPGGFLAQAESGGLMPQLTAGSSSRRSRQGAPGTRRARRLTVAVNLSVTNLLDPHFPDQVVDAARGAPACRRGTLELELTEDLFMADPARARAADRAAAGGRGVARRRRLRHRLLVPRLPARPARHQRAEARPLLRHAPGRRPAGRGHRRVDDQPGALAGHARRRRGRGDDAVRDRLAGSAASSPRASSSPPAPADELDLGVRPV